MASVKDEIQAIPDVCRVCTVSNVAMTNIFNCQNRNIAEDIYFCTGIVIQENDSFPKKICSVCVQQLCIAYKFKLNCLRAEETFRGYRRVKTEIKDEVDVACDMFAADDTYSIPELKPDTKPKPMKKRVVKDYCTKCREKFPTMQELRIHRKKCKKKPQKPEKTECVCELCGKTMSSSSIHQHRKIHQPSEYFCAHCDYDTCNRSDLVKHLKLHTGEKNFQCKYCGKLFTVSNNLKCHVARVHERTLIRKFACTLCEKSYTDKQHLQRHTMTTHSNTRDFECEICRARFGIRKHWKRHMKNLHNVNVPLLKSGRKRAYR